MVKKIQGEKKKKKGSAGKKEKQCLSVGSAFFHAFFVGNVTQKGGRKKEEPSPDEKKGKNRIPITRSDPVNWHRNCNYPFILYRTRVGA